MRWARDIGRMGRKGMHVGFWWEGKSSLGRPRRRWVDKNKMDLMWDEGGIDWIDLAYDTDRWRTLVSTVISIKMLGNS
jgi:hypothetical protein